MINNKRIIVTYVGPGHKSRGGVSSVIQAYMESELSRKYKLRWLETQDDKNKFTKLLFFLSAVVRSPYYYINSDIIHIHTASYNSFYRKSIFILLSKLFKRKLVLHIHGGGFGEFLSEAKQFKKFYILFLLKMADVLICLSPIKVNEIKNELTGKLIKVILNPLLFDISECKGVNSKDTVKILFAGWIEKEKGVFDLIKAFSIVCQNHTNVRLIIAGKGKIAEGKNLALKLNVDEKTEFPGWLSKEEMKKVLSESDIFCLPSYSEGIPMSIIEAMAFSLPVITTPVGGIPDIVESGNTGIFVNPGDVESLSNKLSFLIESKKVRLEIGKNAKKFVKQNCKIDIISKKIGALYTQIL